jgi:16S rRNA (guanine1207-N2)-methyltransferase/23S rRNA (guanine1835-N2)-methyltransferase
LILNDQCGALTLPLLSHKPAATIFASGDSFTALAALEANAVGAAILPRSNWTWVDQPLPLGAESAVLRVPKELSLLEWQLAALTKALPAGAPVLIAGMDKHLPRNLLDVLARYLDQPSAGLGRHKARIFRGCIPAQAKESPAPSWLELPQQGWRLRVDAGVFSRQQLDIGARFFIDHIPTGIEGDICDLGCGNGVVGMVALQSNPSARLWSCDESALAIASAKENIQQYFPARETHFHHGNGLDGLEKKFDLILLNPPFHRGHAVDDSVARMLFRHAKRHLKEGGVLRVIGNSHLNYPVILRRQFGRVQQVARNNKFTITDAFL